MQGNKTLIALVAVAVVAAGAYYLLAGTAQAPTAVTQETQDTQALPAPTDSVEDFAGALEADLAATAAALNAFDADVTASLSALDAASDVTQLYDPEQL